MRTIKFRAWDTKRDKMIPIDTERLGQYLILPHYIPMQFTGLLDKNGKEIYEGDIVNTPDGDTKVMWWEAGFYFKYLENKNRGDYIKINTKECDIIGNIYENPELLSTNPKP